MSIITEKQPDDKVPSSLHESKASREDSVSSEGESDINPAIDYSRVMSRLIKREGEKALVSWDYLYTLSRDECTHVHADGESSWTYPYSYIDYKVCDYCSWN